MARALMAKAELKGGTIKEQVLARLRAGIERHERALADLERLRPGARRNPGDPGRT